MKQYVFGRDTNCDYVILDPQKRVSRKHGCVYELNGVYFIKDMGSANGIYVNNQKIPQNTPFEFNLSDVITLSKDFVLDVFEIMPINLDKTLVMVSQNPNLSSAQNNLITLQNGNKKISLDIEKTSISDVLELDNTPYLSGEDNKVKLPHTFISRNKR